MMDDILKKAPTTQSFIFHDIDFLFVNFENLSSNSLLAVSKPPGNNCLNYRTDIKVHTSKRMG